jgi:hypothetical protein
MLWTALPPTDATTADEAAAIAAQNLMVAIASAVSRVFHGPGNVHHFGRCYTLQTWETTSPQRQYHCLLELFCDRCPMARQIQCLFDATKTRMPDYTSTFMLTNFKLRIDPAILFITHQRVLDYFYQCTRKT